MKLTRIEKIKNHHIFKDFVWDDTIPEFKRYNLIYGWNGSGKTTIANLLRCIEKHKDIITGEFSVSIDNRSVPSSLFATDTSLPQIRVFNREFIEENIFTETKSVSPIFYLGIKSIEKQKELDSLRADLNEKQKAYSKQQQEKIKAEVDVDEFTRDKAREIKELLSSSGTGIYNYYNKTSFKNKATELLASSNIKSKILSNNEKMQCKKQKDATAKPEITTLILSIPDVDKLQIKVNEILAKTVLSEVIESLKHDPKLSGWIEDGLKIHEKPETKNCQFCGQQLPLGLLQKYRGHFNNQFTQFTSEIELLISEIEQLEDTLSRFNFTSKAELYDHLALEYEQATKKAKSDIEEIKKNLNELRLKLLKKKKSPFQEMDSVSLSTLKNTDPLAPVNTIISKHNTETQNFQSTIIQARKKLEESLVCESLNLYKQKNAKIPTILSQINILESDIALLQKQIFENEKQIIEYRSPADELNIELASYLGHADLKFEILENGYQIMRHGELAEGLSEGEKTAIAFLYFLKTLKDKSFKIADGIVVIDDPVSSLDANSLFYAFGFMHARVRDTGQLFILTHNFPFFRQVRNWFNYLPRQQCSYYMTECSYHKETRSAQLLKLDSLLSDYDSEYHYLFKSIYTVANETEKVRNLEQYYHLPNIARRLLEGFLSFKHPQKVGRGLYTLLKEIKFDEIKKSRIERFLNTSSHQGSLDDPEHDMSILSETPQILHDVLDLIENVDKNHYDELVQLIKSSDPRE